MRLRSNLGGRVAAIRSTGATSRSPIASPNHHRVHAEPYGDAAGEPAIASAVTPIVAAIAVLTNAANTVSHMMSRVRSSDGRKSTRRSR